ncbi:MAG: DNA replication/repair protein RecF [Nitrospinota bacterium]|nr:MAG: DNA replication/repair protein RecF [Nitrospinota bacterium]
MFLKEICLRHFRNYAELVWSPSPTINILWGDNGQGKTNLLEAIYVLGNLRSFRTGRREDLIRWGTSRAYIKGILQHPLYTRDLVVEVILEGKGRRLQVNGKEPTRLGEFLGLVSTFLFFPDSLLLIKGGPQERRRFFDRGIYNLHPWYLELVQRYNHALRQRNTLLKSPSSRNASLLDVWTSQYVELGTAIIGERIRYLHHLSKDLEEVKGEFFPEQHSLSLCYHSSLGCVFRFPLSREEGNKEQWQHRIRTRFVQQLKRREQEEQRQGQSLIGPHRDDVQFLWGQHNLRFYGSQGEQRLTVFLVTLAMVRNFTRHTELSPIILFDDVISELDSRRRQIIFDFLTQTGQQVFLTTAELAGLGRFVEGKALYRVTGGSLSYESKMERRGYESNR